MPTKPKSILTLEQARAELGSEHTGPLSKSQRRTANRRFLARQKAEVARSRKEADRTTRVRPTKAAMDQLRADCAALEAQLAAQKSGEKVFEERHAADTDAIATLRTELASIEDVCAGLSPEAPWPPSSGRPVADPAWSPAYARVCSALDAASKNWVHETEKLHELNAKHDRLIADAIANRDRCHETNKNLSRELAEQRDALSEAGVAVADAAAEISNVRRELSRHPRKLTLAERLTGRTARIPLAGPVDASVAGNVPPEPREPNLNPDVPIALPSEQDIHD